MVSKDFKSLNDEIAEIEKDFEVLDSQNPIEAQMIENRLQRLQGIMSEMDSFLHLNAKTNLMLVVSN